MGFLKEKSGLMKNSQMETLRDNLLCLTGPCFVAFISHRREPEKDSGWPCEHRPHPSPFPLSPRIQHHSCQAHCGTATEPALKRLEFW